MSEHPKTNSNSFSRMRANLRATILASSQFNSINPASIRRRRSGGWPGWAFSDSACPRSRVFGVRARRGGTLESECSGCLNPDCTCFVGGLCHQSLGRASAQNHEYLPAFSRGEKLGAFALNESGPALGVGRTPGESLPGRAMDQVLNSPKSYVANAGVAGVYVVFACTDPNQGAKSLTAFLVDAKKAGLSIGLNKGKMVCAGVPYGRPGF